MKSKFFTLILVIFTISFLAGCSNTTEPTPTLPPADTATLPPPQTATPTPLPTKRPTRPPATATPTIQNTTLITLISEDGMELSGYISLPDKPDDKHIGLVLSHGCRETSYVWAPVVGELTKLGYTVVAFDHRGYGGTEGREDFSLKKKDVGTAIEYLQEMGLDRIVCMGSSIGGTACLDSTLRYDLIGLVMLSSPVSLYLSDEDMAKVYIPKLLMVAENDWRASLNPETLEAVFELYELLPEPKQVYIDPGGAHGATIVTGLGEDEALELLLTFLQSLL